MVERVFRQFLDRRHELLKDTTRFIEDLVDGLGPIAPVEPRIDLVVVMQVSGPWWRGFGLAVCHGLEAPDGPPSPGREMRDDVLGRPDTGDARLVHAVFADLSEEAFEFLVL